MEKETKNKEKTFKQPGQKDWAEGSDSEVAKLIEEQSKAISALFLGRRV